MVIESIPFQDMVCADDNTNISPYTQTDSYKILKQQGTADYVQLCVCIWGSRQGIPNLVAWNVPNWLGGNVPN